jgi:hypothetical protein
MTVGQAAQDQAATVRAAVETAAETVQSAAEQATKTVPKGDPDWLGIVVAIGLLGGVGLVVIAGWNSSTAFRPNPEDFKLFAAFYVVAQAIERAVEIGRSVLPAKSPAGKANVALIAAAASTLLGVLASAGLGLYFMEAVSSGASTVPRSWDVLISGLLIAGGTAGLHELIARIEKAKEASAASAVASKAEAAANATNVAATMTASASPAPPAPPRDQ